MVLLLCYASCETVHDEVHLVSLRDVQMSQKHVLHVCGVSLVIRIIVDIDGLGEQRVPNPIPRRSELQIDARILVAIVSFVVPYVFCIDSFSQKFRKELLIGDLLDQTDHFVSRGLENLLIRKTWKLGINYIALPIVFSGENSMDTGKTDVFSNSRIAC